MTRLASIVLFLTVIMIVRYGLVSWSLIRLCEMLKIRPIDNFPLKHDLIVQDIRYSLISSVIFAASGAFLLYGYESGRTMIYHHFLQYGVVWPFISFFLYLIILDTHYYWLHRLLHRKTFYPMHVVHHSSRRPTAWTSFAFHPVEATLQAMVIPVLVFFIPIHWGVLAGILFVMTMFGVTNHLGHEIYPHFLEKRLFLITALHHQNHHRYPTRNYGLFFTFWDKLMKTEKGEFA